VSEEYGLIHVYCGEGKGKTTAAMGLALRAAGSGIRVLVVQFLKDGNSSELKALRRLPEIEIVTGKPVKGFTFAMTPAERELVAAHHNACLQQAVARCHNGEFAMLILDEVIGAVDKGLVDKDLLLDFLRHKPARLEVVMTGRNPLPELVEMAQYVSEINKIKHPYEQGILARIGVEK